jgi:thiol-disulfide isomerase/thioredoxin
MNPPFLNRSQLKVFRLLFAILLFIGVAGFSAATRSEPLGAAWVQATPANVPDLLFTDAAGEDFHRLSEHKGHWVLLNLWATWCAPCVKEMASLDALQADKNGQDLEIMTLAMDREGTVTVPAFFRRHTLKHLAVWLDPSSEAQRRLHADGLPTTLLLNPQGQEVARVTGAVEWMQPENRAFIKQMMK